MSTESLLPCTLAADRESADRAVARLSEAGIDASVASPGSRFHGLPHGMWEVRVPATQAARARVLLGQD